MTITRDVEHSHGPPIEGDVLAGKYRIERLLGKGGMSTVVVATHTVLGHPLAIKYLQRPENPTSAARLLREARALVRLQGEHIARVLDVGELDNGAPFMVMEYLEGKDLAHVLHETGPLPVHEAIDYILQTCEAMAEAHAMGIVHRDLKPANLFLARKRDGSHSIKVIDFGISKANFEAADSQLTQTEAVFGSPRYMSPEQLHASKFVDARSDIWSLGVILYHLLTNDFPFKGSSIAELVLAVHTDEPMALWFFRGDLPVGLEQVIRVCLAREKRRRFANVAELAQRLAEFGGPHTGTAAEKVERVWRQGNQAALHDNQTHSQPGVDPSTEDLHLRPKRSPIGDMAPQESTPKLGAPLLHVPTTASHQTFKADAPLAVSPSPRLKGVVMLMVAGIFLLAAPLGVAFSVLKLKREDGPRDEPAKLQDVSVESLPADAARLMSASLLASAMVPAPNISESARVAIAPASSRGKLSPTPAKPQPSQTSKIPQNATPANFDYSQPSLYRQPAP